MSDTWKVGLVPPIAVDTAPAPSQLDISELSSSEVTLGHVGTTLTALATAAGTQADTPYVSGAGGIVGLLKGLFGKASTAALDTTMQSILSTLQSQKFMTVWTDDSGAFYVLQIAPGGGLNWITPTGSGSGGPGTGMRPAEGVSAIVDSARYQAINTGTGYSINDFLSHIVTTDPSTGVVIGHFWLNVTTEAKLAAAPLNTDITPIAPLPTNAAKETGGNLATIATKISGTLPVSAAVSQFVDGSIVALGAKADAAYAGGGGASTLIALLKGIYNSMIAATPAGSNAIGSVSVTSIPDASFGSGSTVAAIGPFSGGLGSVNTAGFGKLVITCIFAGTGTGSVSFRGSNDGGTTWTNVLASRMDVVTTAPSTSVSNPSTNAIWEVPATHALLQLYCTGYTYTVSPIFSWCLKGPGAFLHTVVDQGAGSMAAWSTQVKSSTSGGISAAYPFANLAASTSPQNVKATPGQVYSIDLSNNSAAWAYFHLHNTAGAPTAGAGVVAQYGIAPGASRTISFADLGYPLSAGIAYTITGGASLTDATTITAANSVVGTIHYN